MTIEKDIKQKVFKNNYQKVAVNLMFTNGWVAHHYTSILKPHNLSEQQYNVLRILNDCQPHGVTINYITERMLDKMSNTSRLVDKLIDKGLVIKIKSKFDRRAVDVKMTDTGLIIFNEIYELVNTWENSFWNITEEDLSALNNLLDKMREPILEDV
jgi:DNA-binding MarR family transcriptional regulator